MVHDVDCCSLLCTVHQVEVVVVALDGGPLLPGEAEVALAVATAISAVAAAVQQRQRGTDSSRPCAGACPCNGNEGNMRLMLSRYAGPHRGPARVCDLMGGGWL